MKPLFWVGSSKKDLLEMPTEVVDVVGYALYLAQSGGKHLQAKPLRGFGSAGVLEVVEDHLPARLLLLLPTHHHHRAASGGVAHMAGGRSAGFALTAAALTLTDPG